MSRPDLSRVYDYYHRYINLVTENELMDAFKAQQSFISFLQDIPVSKRDYKYGDDKWTIKEVVQHIIDAERIFAYRSLCFARKDETPLPGFEENDYAEHSKASSRNWDDVVEEYKIVRRSTELLFKSFDEEQLEGNGIANGKKVYVLGIGFVMIGHVSHHVNVLRERYL